MRLATCERAAHAGAVGQPARRLRCHAARARHLPCGTTTQPRAAAVRLGSGRGKARGRVAGDGVAGEGGGRGKGSCKDPFNPNPTFTHFTPPLPPLSRPTPSPPPPRCGATEYGIRHLATGVGRSSTLRQLWLMDNEARCDGARHLMSALSVAGCGHAASSQAPTYSRTPHPSPRAQSQPHPLRLPPPRLPPPPNPPTAPGAASPSSVSSATTWARQARKCWRQP